MIFATRLAWRLIGQQPIPERTHLGVWGERAIDNRAYALYAVLSRCPFSNSDAVYARAPLRSLDCSNCFPLSADRSLARSLKDVTDGSQMAFWFWQHCMRALRFYIIGFFAIIRCVECFYFTLNAITFSRGDFRP